MGGKERQAIGPSERAGGVTISEFDGKALQQRAIGATCPPQAMGRDMTFVSFALQEGSRSGAISHYSCHDDGLSLISCCSARNIPLSRALPGRRIFKTDESRSRQVKTTRRR